jgi:hypothetical protein
MWTTKNGYYRRLNNCYYRSDADKPKRWHKAVASHSPYGSRNPNAISRYIPNEAIMYHNDRKSFILPCGRTIAESWAALRKSWLGFKIARSNCDTELMTHYASFITKVQLQMGIQVTNFDSYILDERALSEIASSCFYEKLIEDEDTIEEDGPDYDSMMDDAQSKVNGNSENIAPPRQDIFDRSENSCWYLPQKKKENKLQPKILSQTSHIEQSRRYTIPANTSKPNGGDACYYKYPGKGNQAQTQDEIKSWEPQKDEVEEDDECYYNYPGPGNEAQFQEKDEISTEDDEKEREGSVRRSCFYKRNG